MLSEAKAACVCALTLDTNSRSPCIYTRSQNQCIVRDTIVLTIILASDT